MTAQALRRAVRRGMEATGLIGPYYRWLERCVARATDATVDDGRPMPPPDLIMAVSGTADQGWFSDRGRADADNLVKLTLAEGLPIEGPITVLDWGCGCGRIARWIAPQVCEAGGSYAGCDINPRLVAWCARHLGGRYFSNGLLPSLDVPAETIDLVYSHSVLTHLRQETVRVWFDEIRRVLKPGGLAILTFNDEAYADRWGPTGAAERLKHEPYVVWNDALEGSNYISAWTTRDHLTRLAAPALEVRQIIPGRTDIPEQAIAVLARRAASANVGQAADAARASP